mgnify:CR=1 FL=1
MNALTIQNLYKTYPQGVKALEGVDLQIKQGDFFGLLGPNGAGKSTIIGIITGLVTKTSGKVQIMHYDIDANFTQARQLIGIVPQEMNFSIFETVLNIVVDQAGYYGIPRSIAVQRAEKYLKELGLWEKRDAVSRTLSGGMKRRLMIVRALIHEPKILILDEPTAGVDVELRRGMWDFLVRVNKAGTTIVLTTHYLEEAEQLCHTIAIINKGIIIENTSKKNLLAKLESQTYLLDIKGTIKDVPAVSDFVLRLMDENTLEVDLKSKQTLTMLLSALAEQKVEVLSARAKSNRLEELFLRFVEGKQ